MKPIKRTLVRKGNQTKAPLVHDLNQVRQSMHKLIDHFFSNFPLDINQFALSSEAPALHFENLDNEYQIRLKLPYQHTREDIELLIDGQTLTIKIENNVALERTDDRKGSLVQQHSFSSYYKRFPIPQDADISRISTDKRQGIYIIKIPKK